MTPPEPRVHTAAFADLDVATLYALLRLRVDVFVVEQECAYPELDGRDVEPSALHCWIDDDAGPVAALRILREPDGAARIGRVVTAPRARHQRLAAALLRHSSRPPNSSGQARSFAAIRAYCGMRPSGQ